MTPRQSDPEGRYVGLMSGTSLDGIDATVVTFGGADESPSTARLEWFETRPLGPELEGSLRRAVAGEVGTAELCDIDFALGERLAEVAREAVAAAGGPVTAIGSHGQTVWHRPPADGSRGATLQLGEPAVIAERTGVPVVADFRVRDVAAGGQGAPLTPVFDALLLRTDHSRLIQNIGGMANLTALPAAGDPAACIAFDTGPGVAMIDAAVHELTGADMDRDGALAAAGTADEALVREWLEDEFFELPPPRSTGREHFGTPRVRAWLREQADLSAGDAIATLTEVTARSIAVSYRLLPFPIEEVLLCGGGARNPEIRRRLAAHLPDVRIESLDSAGWNGDAREAAAFALLARQHVLGHPVDLAWATGAPGPRKLGKLVPA